MVSPESFENLATLSIGSMIFGSRWSCDRISCPFAGVVCHHIDCTNVHRGCLHTVIRDTNGTPRLREDSPDIYDFFRLAKLPAPLPKHIWCRMNMGAADNDVIKIQSRIRDGIIQSLNIVVKITHQINRNQSERYISLSKGNGS